MLHWSAPLCTHIYTQCAMYTLSIHGIRVKLGLAAGEKFVHHHLQNQVSEIPLTRPKLKKHVTSIQAPEIVGVFLPGHSCSQAEGLIETTQVECQNQQVMVAKWTSHCAAQQLKHGQALSRLYHVCTTFVVREIGLGGDRLMQKVAHDMIVSCSIMFQMSRGPPRGYTPPSVHYIVM